MKEKVLFVGTHVDDIELAAGGTIQALKNRDYEVLGLMCSSGLNGEQAEKRTKAGKECARILGYKPIFGGLMEPELSVDSVKEVVYETVKEHSPDFIFGHSEKDCHHHHVDAAYGTLSGGRSVRNHLYFTGPLRKTTFSPQVFFTFGEKEYRKKMKALEVQRKAYGVTRYFTEEYASEVEWLGQKASLYKERGSAPLVTRNGKKQIPYAEGFEVERLVDPF